MMIALHDYKTSLLASPPTLQDNCHLQTIVLQSISVVLIGCHHNLLRQYFHIVSYFLTKFRNCIGIQLNSSRAFLPQKSGFLVPRGSALPQSLPTVTASDTFQSMGHPKPKCLSLTILYPVSALHPELTVIHVP